ncbi:non-canonical purine NTP pyrophosphatase [uncultured Spongiibacter sp.]|uniref:non-canonical purine NTP pyrophosphatase n=1 Tax=uncultured Spongiibacter sp. TaxID=870896 RepID=UPI00338F44C5
MASCYAGAGAKDADNNAKLLRDLADIRQRKAHFHCALVFVRHPEDPAPIICEGRWLGEVVDTPRGDNGFGYDPHFFIPALNKCAAELPPEQKNRLSHRGLAVSQLVKRLPTEFGGS